MKAKDLSEGCVCAGSRLCARAETKGDGEEGGTRTSQRESFLLPLIDILAQSSWAEQDLAGRTRGQLLAQSWLVECLCWGARQGVGSSREVGDKWTEPYSVCSSMSCDPAT